PARAMMRALPGARPRTQPLDATVATLVFEDVSVTSGVDWKPVSVQVSRTESPSTSVAAAVLSVIRVGVGGVTCFLSSLHAAHTRAIAARSGSRCSRVIAVRNFPVVMDAVAPSPLVAVHITGCDEACRAERGGSQVPSLPGRWGRQ